MKTNLWWIRRDLRLRDNQALDAALANGEAVVPVFVLDPVLLSSAYAGEKRVAFPMHGLRELDRALRDRGSCLVVRQGKSLDQLTALAKETKAAHIYAEADVSPYARRRDEAVRQQLALMGRVLVKHVYTTTK